MTTPSRPPSDAQNQGAEEDRVRPQDTANNFESTPRRSVSFSGQPQEHGQVETESSADEHTTIIRRQRGGDRSYSGTAQSVRRSSLRAGSSPGGQATQEQQKQSNSPSASHEHDQPPKLNWWKSFLDKYGTVELQNKGSVARDHLALERTFLAWLRTSLSFASIGIAVTQLFRLDQTLAQTPHDHPRVQKLRHVGKPLGATFLGVGILVLLVGFHRYFESQHYVMLGKFPASRGSVALISFCTGALVVASLVTILTIAPAILT